MYPDVWAVGTFHNTMTLLTSLWLACWAGHLLNCSYIMLMLTLSINQVYDFNNVCRVTITA